MRCFGGQNAARVSTGRLGWVLTREQLCQTMRMKLAVTIYQDEDGWYVVDCPVIPGCATQGRTEAEALANIIEAIQGCLAARRDAGMQLTIDTREVEIPALA